MEKETLQIELRAKEEIQAAHDRLVAIILGDVPNPFEEASLEFLNAAADVLCWVLQHDHNQNFGRNLALIDERLAAMGYALGDTGSLRVRSGVPDGKNT